MIILFNLNKYVGGGEVLLIRFAEFLRENNIDYSIMSCKENSFIADESARLQLNFIPWPHNNDSVAYMSDLEKDQLINSMSYNFRNYTDLSVFTFCFRDAYNCLYTFSNLIDINVSFSTGIYHPKDIYYLSSMSLNKKYYINFNRGILKKYISNSSIIFMNDASRDISVGHKNETGGSIAPIPIKLPNEIPLRYKNDRDENEYNKTRIICISRLVDFKIAAVLAIVRFVKNNPQYHLDLIGRGNLKFVIDLYCRFYNVQNIKLFDNIEPHQLDEIIDNSSIGYAQGTSILEISKRGIPTIIAPYSRLRDIFDTKLGCFGVFGEKNDFNFGDITSPKDHSFVSIPETIKKIENNYEFYRDICINHTKRFSSDKVFNEILTTIQNGSFTNQDLNFNPPRPPFIKRVLKFLLMSKSSAQK